MTRCCLCFDEDRPANVLNGGGVPLCWEHNAACKEQSRKTAAPRVVTLGSLTPEEAYLEHAARAALLGAST
jgi:hypothetical protein